MGKGAVTEEVLCLDTSILIKFLLIEEPRHQSETARDLVLRGITGGRLVAPGCAWGEVGSVLRKKMRQGLLTQDDAQALWASFCQLPIEYVEMPAVRARAWEIADHYGLLTLYDAAFLACTEIFPAPSSTVREFWTADDHLVRDLGSTRPAYVRAL